MAIYSCKDCADRVLGCHEYCETYLAEKKLNDERKRAAQSEILRYENDSIAARLSREAIRKKKARGRKHFTHNH